MVGIWVEGCELESDHYVHGFWGERAAKRGHLVIGDVMGKGDICSALWRGENSTGLGWGEIRP